MDYIAVMNVPRVAVELYFTLCIAGLAASLCFKNELRPLIDYGKTRFTTSESSQNRSNTVLEKLASWQVSKSTFSHFYILASVLSLTSVAFCFTQHKNLVLPVMMAVHALRRCVETQWLERPSGSTMWVGHYVAGMSFYTFTTLAFLLFSLEHASTSQSSTRPSLLQAIASGGFLAANYVQHHTHVLLAKTRARLSAGEYVDLRTGGFQYLVTPHYTAECGLYLCIALWSLSLTLQSSSDATKKVALLPWLSFVWTVLILSLSASGTDAWGRAKFPKTWDVVSSSHHKSEADGAGGQQLRRRWVIIPFVY